MTVKQETSGVWRVEVDRKGIPRVRRGGFDTREAAELFEREYIAKHRNHYEQSVDNRTLKELIECWYRYHGINLADGERRKRALLQMALELKNPVASKLSAEQFVEYRFHKTQGEGAITFKTFNNLHCYLSAVFNKLKKLKVISYVSPIAEVEFVKIQERQLSYLSQDQIKTVLNSIRDYSVNPSTWYVTQICLRTGARWSEAEKLKRKQLHNGRITFEFTKSKRTRTVPIDAAFYRELDELARHKNPDDRLFDNCIGAFRRAVKRTDLSLPRGQMTHILRHTFASHFVMNGGNVVSLQKVLGHADIKMTMRYAHLSPDHLMDAVNLNPLAA